MNVFMLSDMIFQVFWFMSCLSLSLAQMSLLELNYAFESVERSTVCRTTQFRAIDF